MIRSLSGEQAWAVIFGLVVYHEFACTKGELLSEAVDRGLEKHPVLVYGFVAVTVAHLLNPYRWVYLIHLHITKGK